MFAQLFRLPAQVGFVFLAVDSCIRLAALVTVPRDRLPSAGLAWLMAIFLLPVVGGIAYLVIGRSQLPQRRRENQTHASRGFLEDTPQVAELVVSDPNPTWLGPLARMMRELGAAPLLGGARVEVVLGFEDQVSHLVDAIDSARRVAYVQFYTLAHDSSTAPVFDALARAAHRGVKVRVLADYLGSVRASTVLIASSATPRHRSGGSTRASISGRSAVVPSR